jgi:O-antigen ligase
MVALSWPGFWLALVRPEQNAPLDLATGAIFVAVALIVAVLTWRRPALGVAALVALSPFALARYVGPTSITLVKVGLVGCAIALIARRTDLAAFQTAPARTVTAALAFAIAAIALSALHAQYHMPVVREAFKTIEYALLFIVAMVAYARDPDDRPLWIALEITTALVCLSALSDYAFGSRATFAIGSGLVPRIAGVLEGPNQLAGWLEIVIPVLFARNLLHRDGALLAVVAFALVVEVLTFSRAGIAGTIIACVTVTAIMRPSRAASVRIGLAAIGACALFVGLGARWGFPTTYFSLHEVAQPDDHLGTRGQLWNAARELWRSSPVFGVGAGNFELDLGRVGLPTIRTHANSLYWQSLAEGGVVMLASTLFTFGAILFTFARSQVRRPIVVGVFAATLALALHQFFDDLFFFTKVGTMFWLMIGVAVAELAARQLFVRQRERTFAAAVVA